MKKNWLYMLLLATSLGGGVASCSSENVDQVSEHTEGTPMEITFSVSAGGTMASRTPVVVPGDDLRGKQHVTRVWLYIYDQKGNYLAGEEVEWYKGDSIGAVTKDRKHQLKYTGKFQPNEDYTFLAIGLDDKWNGKKFEGVNSAKAYGLPEAMENKTLDEAKAVLADKLTRRNIAESELFAGHLVKTGAEIAEGKNIVIDLFRRVAGVSFAFKNIPQTVEGQEVHFLAIRICGPQNKSVSLIPKLPEGTPSGTEPKDIPDEDFIDYEADPLKHKDADLLFFTSLRDEGMTLGPGGGGSNEPDIPTDPTDPEYPTDPVDPETGGIWKDPLYAGRYVLPAKFDESHYTDFEENGNKRSTLVLELWGKDKMPLVKKALIIEKTIGGTRSGTGIIEGSKNRYQYPLRPNQFYRIGKKGDAVDLSGEEAEIEIEIDEVWDEYYGGSMDGSDSSSGTGMDNSWGEHEGGNLVTK